MTSSTKDLTVVCWRLSLDIDDGGGKRVRAFLDAFDDLGIGVDLRPTGPAAAELATMGESSRLHTLKRGYLPLPLASTAMAELRTSAVAPGPVLSMVPAAHRWALECGQAAWLDYFDLWSEFTGPPTHLPGAGITRFAQRRLWRRRENNEVRSAAAITCAAPGDCARLSVDAIFLPTPVLPRADLIRPLRPTRGGRPVRAGFLANFGYAPNRAAYDILVREWCPRLREAGVDDVAVAGYGSADLPRAHGVTVVGEVAEVAEFYESIDVALAPVPSGGGMKVKVVEALAYGLPVIASDHALEGLPRPVAALCSRVDDVLEVTNIRVAVDQRRAAEVDLSAFTSPAFRDRVAAVWDSLETHRR